DAAAPGLAGVLVRRPPAGRGVDDDLVRRVRDEGREIDALRLGKVSLDADLRRTADRRAQREVQARPAVAVGKLDESRRLEALAPVGIDVDVLRRAPDDAADRTRMRERHP